MNKLFGKNKVLIAAGGTGGHLFPGVAIAEEIKRVHPDTKIVFAGTSRGIESAVCPKLGFKLELMRSVSIKDRKGLKKLAAFAWLPFSVIEAMVIHVRCKTSVVVSIGGYAAGPLVVAAWLMGVPAFIVEPNAIAGFTNRNIGRLAKRIFVAFDEARKFFPEEKVVFSGNLVRTEIYGARRALGEPGGILTVFVFGGSQGAHRLNEAMVGAARGLAEIKNKIRIIHQTGKYDEVRVIKHAYDEAGIESDVFEFTDSIWECYSKTDLVISRAGAITVQELKVLAIPSLLVPYPFAADDHQRANAQSIVKLGGARLIPDAECTGSRIAFEIKAFVSSPEMLSAMKKALQKETNARAEEKIVEEIGKYI